MESQGWAFRNTHISAAVYTPFELKKKTMMATLRKVHKMASDTYTLRKSAQQKIMEFVRLKYPIKRYGQQDSLYNNGSYLQRHSVVQGTQLTAVN